MLKKYLAAAVASFGLFAALPAGTAAASGSASFEPDPVCNQNWSTSSQWGIASGQWRDSETLAKGTVTDTKADGRCPYVRTYTSSGSYIDSDWAGPKGDSSPVLLDTTYNDPFVRITMGAINC
ncbi:hypothetical protein Z951_15475 [Streptomyces sp. PRh5]|uniref:hypothetical protein n=1 Tax=Streptomyces sp. PRh5 TaxID=1158056 RepID=UPI00044C8626|nr:hypothetical protein [Streptomyces sp. PRh5]EXU67323.1 hypothetical protein Z951_15475 [Streptomyces sp. PRh5]